MKIDFKEIRKAKKALKISKLNYFKAYLTGIFFATLIMLIPFLLIFNLTIFYRYIEAIHYLSGIAIIFYMFFILLFKDIALEVYVLEYKEINHKKLLALFMTIFGTLVMVVVFIIVRMFRWW